ncbi:hypothetical protein D3C85_1524940 [compost metagenome]
MSSLSEESRWLTCHSWPRSRVSASNSVEFNQAPSKVCGNRRLSLKITRGNSGVNVPTFRTLFETLSLPVKPSSLYSSSARRVSRSRCNSPVPPLRLGLESSLTPSSPWASMPKPRRPSV